MSKLYIQHKLVGQNHDVSFGGSGRTRRRRTMGPGGGSDPSNTTDSRVDQGGLRYMTNEDRGNLQRNVASTIIGGGAGAITARVANRVRNSVVGGSAGLSNSVVNNNTD